MSKPMSEEYLREIQARCEAATPGPWEAWTEEPGDCVVVSQEYEAAPDEDGDWICNVDPNEVFFLCPGLTGAYPVGVAFNREVEDTEFIAHARTDVPALLAEVELLRADNERQARSIQHLRNKLRKAGQR
jgi:hypothetical protein